MLCLPQLLLAQGFMLNSESMHSHTRLQSLLPFCVPQIYQQRTEAMNSGGTGALQRSEASVYKGIVAEERGGQLGPTFWATPG